MKILIKNAFNILVKNFTITLTILAIISFLQLLQAVLFFNVHITLINIVLGWTSIVLMFVALFSGWFNMLKKVVVSNSEEKTSNTIENSSWTTIFFTGISEKFFVNLKIALTYFICLFLTFVAVYKAVTYIYPKFSVSASDYVDTLNELMYLSYNAKFVLTHKIKLFMLWSAILSCLNFVFLYLTSFLVVATYLSEENKLLSIIRQATIFVCKNFLNTVKVFVLILFSYFLLMFLGSLSTFSTIFATLFLFCGCYYVTFYMLMVFLFYERETQNNSNNGCDSDRQDKVCR